MQIQEIPSSGKNRDLGEYRKIVLSHPFGTIHQLPEWGEFQVKSGARLKQWFFVATGNGTTEPLEERAEKKSGQKKEENPARQPDLPIQASALVLKQKLPLGLSWLYVPRGPLIGLNKTEAARELFSAIRKLAEKEKAVFVRFDPPIMKEEATSWERFWADLKAKNAHAHYQPEATLVVDLTPSEEEILKQMKPKGRYNIKVAQKHGVKVRVSGGSPEDIEAFYNLLKTTTERDKFHGHPQKYYEEMLKALGPSRAKLYLAEYTPEGAGSTGSTESTGSTGSTESTEASENSSENGGEGHGSMKSSSLTGSKHPPILLAAAPSQPQKKLLAAAIVTYFADTATYYFGASSNENRNVMAPYFLHWQAMLDAKNAGYKTYDFFGIAPENSRNHPWQSVTEFKLKFGGKRIEYMDAREIICKPFWYWSMRVAKVFLKKIGS